MLVRFGFNKLIFNGRTYIQNFEFHNDCGKPKGDYAGLDWAWENYGIHRWRGTTKGNYAIACWNIKNVGHPASAHELNGTKIIQDNNWFILFREMTDSDVGGKARPELKAEGISFNSAPMIAFDDKPIKVAELIFSKMGGRKSRLSYSSKQFSEYVTRKVAIA